MSRALDLRSDTVTRPTPEMLRAMAAAEVGDDCYGEDPTVNRLQELAAERLGKEAALLVSSGTQGNLVGILSHCQPGDEVVCDDQSHIVLGEMGGLAIIGGLQLRTLPNPAGIPTYEDVAATVHAGGGGYLRTGVLSIENTHNRRGGMPIDAVTMDRYAALAHERGAKVHVDGARLFNAAVALGVPASRLVAPADSATFCLSKGLGAPVGSVLCGDRACIDRARRWRKMVGGAQRQAGVVAAAGIVALERMVDRLADDHANARRLAEGLAELPGIALDPDRVQTNLIFFDVVAPALTARELSLRMAREGVLFHALNARTARMVTHHDVAAADIPVALAAARRVLVGD